MKKIFIRIIIILSILLAIYLVINIVILLYKIIDPEGFWGFFWFYTIFLIGLSILSSFFAFIVYVIVNRKEKGIGILSLGLLGSLIFGSLIGFGPTIFISKTLSDRYRYIRKSDRYFSEGKFVNALNYAKKVYEKSINKDLPSKIFIIPYWYEKNISLGMDHFLDVYNATLNYGYCLQAAGKDFVLAEKMFKECLDISTKYFPEKSEYNIFPLLGCFDIYIARGNRQKSDSIYFELNKHLNKVDKYELDNVITSLILYSIYAQQNGESELTFNLHKQALEVFEKREGDKNVTTHLYLRILVISGYLRNHDNLSAVKLIDETKSLAKKNKDKEIYLNYLQVKSMMYNLIGKPNEEGKVLKEIEKRTKRKQGKHSLEYAIANYRQAIFKQNNGDKKNALLFFNKAVSIALSYTETQPGIYYDILLGSAICEYLSNNITNSRSKLLLVNSFLIQSLQSNLLFLTENEKENYNLYISDKLGWINSIYASMNEKSTLGTLYNNILFTKELALQSNQFFRELVAASADDNLLRSYQSIKSSKDSLNMLRQAGFKDELALQELSDNIARDEKEFILDFAKTPFFKNYWDTKIDWTTIRDNLKKSDIAIEIINTPSLSQTDGSREYFALIIKPQTEIPELVHLFNDRSIKPLIRNTDTKDKINSIYSETKTNQIYNLMWKPIVPHIKESSTIYVALSGVFHQISLPALTIEHPYNVVVLSSTRNIIHEDLIKVPKQSAKRNAYLFGNIDFTGTLTHNRIFRPNKLLRTSGKSKHSNNIQLQYTKTEIEGISEILINNDYKVDTIIGNKATEKSFKEVQKEFPEIIHIATHGFYLPDSLVNDNNGLASIGMNNFFEYQKPLFRSGLLFAGSELQSYNDVTSDGILTAFDVSKLDLSSTDLVIMSACESGLGDIRGDEGVFGLQRAFKLAGVNSIIMTLWKIPDLESSELMQYFYNYYTSGISKHESLKLAQKKIKEKHPEPYNWAAFMLID